MHRPAQKGQTLRAFFVGFEAVEGDVEDVAVVDELVLEERGGFG